MAKLWKPVDEIPARTRQGGSKVRDLVEDFVGSGERVGEVQVWAKPSSVANSIRAHLARSKAPVTVRTVGERVFLVRGRKKRSSK